MLSFREWSNGKSSPKYKKKGKKNEQPANQGSTEVRNVNQQGKADRGNQEIVANDFHYLPEP
jgi:hypothetical protein